jgi:hypothetical protein
LLRRANRRKLCAHGRYLALYGDGFRCAEVHAYDRLD